MWIVYGEGIKLAVQSPGQFMRVFVVRDVGVCESGSIGRNMELIEKKMPAMSFIVEQVGDECQGCIVSYGHPSGRGIDKHLIADSSPDDRKNSLLTHFSLWIMVDWVLLSKTTCSRSGFL